MQARSLLPLLLLGSLCACREGDTRVTFVPIRPADHGNQGCNGDDTTFVSPVFTFGPSALIGNMSQMAALAPPADPMDPVRDVIYVTGSDRSILELDFTLDPAAPTSQVIVPGGIIDTLVMTVLNSATPPEISGIAIVDPSFLLVAEHTSNTLILIDITNPVTSSSVGFYVGYPNQTAGMVDGTAGASRFSFPSGEPLQLCATGDLRVFVADRGNHAIREVQLGATVLVRTLAGTGVPFHANGSLASTGFDSPAGLSVSCAGQLVVAEVGPLGQRLRTLQVGNVNFLGSRSGASMTLAGDGTAGTAEGVGPAAMVSTPLSPVTTAQGEVYWVDGGTGVLRRMDLVSGAVDCPNPDYTDCADAVANAGGFSGAGHYATAITASGYLYVLNANAGAISLVSDTP